MSYCYQLEKGNLRKLRTAKNVEIKNQRQQLIIFSFELDLRKDGIR